MKLTGFFSLLSQQQKTQLLSNPQDFEMGDPSYLLIKERAASMQKQSKDKDDET